MSDQHNGAVEAAVERCKPILNAIAKSGRVEGIDLHNLRCALAATPPATEQSLAGEPVAWMYRYRIQYVPKLECTKPLPDKIAFSVERWNDAEARHWTETPLYATPQPAPVTGGEDALRKAGHSLALAAGALNVATDAMAELRAERVAVLDALKGWQAALSPSAPEGPSEQGKLIAELVEVARSALDWIDALPDDLVASLPAMPGLSRDDAEHAIFRARKGAAS